MFNSHSQQIKRKQQLLKKSNGAVVNDFVAVPSKPKSRINAEGIKRQFLNLKLDQKNSRSQFPPPKKINKELFEGLKIKCQNDQESIDVKGNYQRFAKKCLEQNLHIEDKVRLRYIFVIGINLIIQYQTAILITGVSRDQMNRIFQTVYGLSCDIELGCFKKYSQNNKLLGMYSSKMKAFVMDLSSTYLRRQLITGEIKAGDVFNISEKEWVDPEIRKRQRENQIFIMNQHTIFTKQPEKSDSEEEIEQKKQLILVSKTSIKTTQESNEEEEDRYRRKLFKSVLKLCKNLPIKFKAKYSMLPKKEADILLKSIKQPCSKIELN